MIYLVQHICIPVMLPNGRFGCKFPFQRRTLDRLYTVGRVGSSAGAQQALVEDRPKKKKTPHARNVLALVSTDIGRRNRAH